ncbi:MAG: dihydrodipicolinate synthase family protein [Acidobacteria bacterium]|nr:dihydrodipicolinate synthase family protein [Acidobacteriota bacterium]
MKRGEPSGLRRGILPVVQTPFHENLSLDEESLAGLAEASIRWGACGFLAPAVASEVVSLSAEERRRVLEIVCAAARGRVPVLAGASAESEEECREHGRVAARIGADAILVAVPQRFYAAQDQVVPFFAGIASSVDLPLVIQDLEWSGPGLSIAVVEQLAAEIPTLVGLKVETVPAGPKYTQVRQALGMDFFIAGGWAAPQMIEALDRGVDAMIPECSMVPVYAEVFRLHAAGRRDLALALFRQMLPMLAYANQEIRTSIAFFKRLLVRKGVFRTARLRGGDFLWDCYNGRIADELIDSYLALERSTVGH